MKTYKDVIKLVKTEILADILICFGFTISFISDFIKEESFGLTLSMVSNVLILLGCIRTFTRKNKELIIYTSMDYCKYSSLINFLLMLLILVSMFNTNKYMVLFTIICGVGFLINGILEIKHLKEEQPEVITENIGEK